MEAADSDAFWSGSLEVAFEDWEQGNRAAAVRQGFRHWCENVQTHLDGVLGPDSLFLFDYAGVTPAERKEWRDSLDDIPVCQDRCRITSTKIYSGKPGGEDG